MVNSNNGGVFRSPKYLGNLLGGVLLACAVAQAAEYPTRPIRYVVAFPPGGVNDAIARILSQRMNDTFGVPVIVDNRPGAGGNLGSELVARATPDGHTLLNISTAQAISQSLYLKLAYNLERDLTPVIMLATSPLIVAIYPGVNARTVRDLITASKTQPIRFSSGGIGTISHLSGEMLSRAVGFAAIHVPYKGGGPAAVDLIAGQVQMMINAVTDIAPAAKAGRMRAIGAMAEKRHPQLPDVATLPEQGYKDFVLSNWVGIVAPAGTPKDRVQRLYTEIARIMKEPAIGDRVISYGFDSAVGSPEQFGRHIRAEVSRFAKAVKESGVRVE
jgi:tripartite-type tricarboxylate transporter receptor subunit TctC